jgi:hypothetical protein
MRRFTMVGIIGVVLVLITTAVATTASASASEDRQYGAPIRNLYYGECLSYVPDEEVSLRVCDGAPVVGWYVEVGYVSEIRSVLTGECLEDVDTDDPWGGVVMHPCTGAARQLWGIPEGPGLIQNLGSARYLKANHERVVYTGDVEHYYPHWEVGN